MPHLHLVLLICHPVTIPIHSYQHRCRCHLHQHQLSYQHTMLRCLTFPKAQCMLEATAQVAAAPPRLEPLTAAGIRLSTTLLGLRMPLEQPAGSFPDIHNSLRKLPMLVPLLAHPISFCSSFGVATSALLLQKWPRTAFAPSPPAFIEK